MNRHTTKPSIVWLAVIGFILFIVTNWWPLFSVMFGFTDLEDLPENKPAITKQEASDAAEAWVKNATKDEITDRFVLFQTDSKLSGYLQKNDLYEEYADKWQNEYPIDYFQVEVDTTGADYVVNVHLHKPEVFGWRTMNVPSAATELDKAPSLESQELSGFEFVGESDGALLYRNESVRIGEALLQAKVLASNDRLLSFQPSFGLPESYLSWHKEQERSRASLEMLGLGLQLLTLIGAITCAMIYKGQISYRRGLFLTGVYFVIESIHNINMYPAFRTLDAENGHFAAVFTIVFQEFIYLIIAGMLYLTLVAGDGMWKHLGVNLWKRWSDPDYGAHVRHSMRIGYLLALPIMGLQGILYLIGEQWLDVWSTEDPLFSNLNQLNPLLFPLLAWRAAIMEEGIYRLFMIAIFIKLIGGLFKLIRADALNRIHVHTLLAVIAAGMIWAIGHVSYPVYPAYTRFVEVTILGLAFGWIFLRFGLIAAIFAHVVLDSILMSLSIVFTGGGSAIAVPFAFFYIALPAIVARAIDALHRNRRRPAQT